MSLLFLARDASAELLEGSIRVRFGSMSCALGRLYGITEGGALVVSCGEIQDVTVSLILLTHQNLSGKLGASVSRCISR